MVNLDSSSIKAVIFDMDGTMINNMPYHKRAWIEFCKIHGLILTDEEFKTKFSGKKNKDILEAVFNKSLTDKELENYTLEKEHLYQQIYAPDIHEVTGLSKLIDELKTREVKIAIATTAPKTNRDFGLKALNLEGKFDSILGDEHVSKGKPDPEIYLLSAKTLSVSPQECIVFEDSPVGIEAGKRAGMRVIGLTTTHSSKELSNAGNTINDFSEVILT